MLHLLFRLAHLLRRTIPLLHRLVLCSITATLGILLGIALAFFPISSLVTALLVPPNSHSIFAGLEYVLPTFITCGFVGLGAGLSVGQWYVLWDADYHIPAWRWIVATTIGACLGLALGYFIATYIVSWDAAWDRAHGVSYQSMYDGYMGRCWIVFGPIFGSVVGGLQLAAGVVPGWSRRWRYVASLGAGTLGGVGAAGVSWHVTVDYSPFVFATLFGLVTTLALPWHRPTYGAR